MSKVFVYDEQCIGCHAAVSDVLRVSNWQYSLQLGLEIVREYLLVLHLPVNGTAVSQRVANHYKNWIFIQIRYVMYIVQCKKNINQSSSQIYSIYLTKFSNKTNSVRARSISKPHIEQLR